MGLRETKVARTRARIISEAIKLFTVDGYDQTTMEAIAEAADIGTSTLYRYFSSKDLILIGPFEPAGGFAEFVASRPAEEELFAALAQAIREVATEMAKNDQILQVRALLDQNASARARLWDFLARDRELLEQTISTRAGLPRTDVRVALAARVALLVVELASDTWRDNARDQSMSQITEDILHQFSELSIDFIPGATRAPSL
jgi:AcrR family transcriptional regulator